MLSRLDIVLSIFESFYNWLTSIGKLLENNPNKRIHNLMELGFQISIYKLKTCLLLFLTFLGMHYFSSLVRIFFLRMSINFVLTNWKLYIQRFENYIQWIYDYNLLKAIRVNWTKLYFQDRLNEYFWWMLIGSDTVLSISESFYNRLRSIDNYLNKIAS